MTITTVGTVFTSQAHDLQYVLLLLHVVAKSSAILMNSDKLHQQCKNVVLNVVVTRKDFLTAALPRGNI